MAPSCIINNFASILGGLALQGNPWRCSCSNNWVGLWLRRWMRETLQLHTSGVERSHAIQNIVRSIKCDEKTNPSSSAVVREDFKPIGHT